MTNFLNNLIGNPILVFAIIFFFYIIDLSLSMVDHWIHNTFLSSKFRDGYIGKMFLLIINLIVGLGATFLFTSKDDMFILVIIINISGAYLLFNELVSILGHLSALGLTLPKTIQKRIDVEVEEKQNAKTDNKETEA
jgi:toxin secretion/phage lysis holin